MIEGLHHIAIICSSDRSLEFYKKLGFCEDSRRERPEHNDTLVWLKGFGVYLELFLYKEHPCRQINPEPYGLSHLALCVNDLDSIHYNLKDYNPGEVTIGHTGMRTCLVNDPDGTTIELKEKKN